MKLIFNHDDDVSSQQLQITTGPSTSGIGHQNFHQAVIN